MATTEVLEGLSRTQAAHRIGVAPETISKYARLGRLNYIMTPYGRVYQAEDIDRLDRERKAKKRQKRGKKNG